MKTIFAVSYQGGFEWHHDFKVILEIAQKQLSYMEDFSWTDDPHLYMDSFEVAETMTDEEITEHLEKLGL